MLATFSWLALSCHAEGRRKRGEYRLCSVQSAAWESLTGRVSLLPDYRLEEHLLEFHVQVDNELFVHTMWPCEDPEVGREGGSRPASEAGRQAAVITPLGVWAVVLLDTGHGARVLSQRGLPQHASGLLRSAQVALQA